MQQFPQDATYPSEIPQPNQQMMGNSLPALSQSQTPQPQQQMMGYSPTPPLLSQPSPQYQESLNVQNFQKSQILGRVKWIKVAVFMADFAYLILSACFLYFLCLTPSTLLNDILFISTILAEVVLVFVMIGNIALCGFNIPPRDNNRCPLKFWLFGQICYLFLHFIQLVLTEMAIKLGDLYDEKGKYEYVKYYEMSHDSEWFRDYYRQKYQAPYLVAVPFAFIGLCWLPFRFWSIYSVASYNEYLSANPLIAIVPPRQEPPPPSQPSTPRQRQPRQQSIPRRQRDPRTVRSEESAKCEDCFKPWDKK